MAREGQKISDSLWLFPIFPFCFIIELTAAKTLAGEIIDG
jgi:hypothetical protein